MSNKITSAFDNIKAEEKLKESVKLYIRERQDQLGARKRTARTLFTGRAAAIPVSLVAVLIFSVVLLSNLYFTANAYISFDVNPSIELAVNVFERVIDVYAYNPDGESVLAEISLKHRDYRNAFDILIDIAEKNDFFKDGSFISVSVQTDNETAEHNLLSEIQGEIEYAVAKHHDGAKVDIDTIAVGADIRNSAHELNISPSKYLAIMEFMDIDPTVTFEGCKNHSIGEIKRLISEHSENHHTNSDDNASSSSGGNDDSGNQPGQHSHKNECCS